MYQQLISRLKEYLSCTDMNARYMSRFYPPGLAPIESSQLFRDDSFYTFTLRLRRIISNHLAGRFDQYELNFWIIQRWGGIFNFRDNPSNRAKMVSFAEALNERKPLNLSNIASLSKIASFVNPDHFFIYDSRAVYSLNRILLDTDYQGGYYPIPHGRGDQYRVQELRNCIRERVTGRKAFYPNKTAYYQYSILR